MEAMLVVGAVIIVSYLIWYSNRPKFNKDTEAIYKREMEEIKVQFIGKDEYGTDCYKREDDSWTYKHGNDWYKASDTISLKIKENVKMIIIEGEFIEESWHRGIVAKKAKLDEKKARIKKIEQFKANDIVYCPKCLSQQVSAQKKGFSAGKAIAGVVLTGGIGLVGGAIGANKMQLVCLKCGNQFQYSK